VDKVVRLALLPFRRVSGNVDPLAPSGVATAVALQVESGSSTDSIGTAPTDPAHGDGESAVGRGEDCQRIAAQARFAGLAAYCAQVDAEATAGSAAW
jgi:hypothetical protein